MTRITHIVLATALATLLPPAGAQAQDREPELRTVKTGVFTDAQALRGEELMQATCSECHEPSEFDATFIDSWVGADVAELYDILSSTMPEDRPGALEPQQYADALAYIFKLNGMPAGNEELKPDMALLRYILIER